MNREALRRAVADVANEQFSRSGGPGGQNVNKVNTRVTLRIPLSRLPLSEEHLHRLRTVLASRITDGDELVLHGERRRSQHANRKEVLDRAVEMIASLGTPPRRRRPTRPSKAAKERRLTGKHVRSRTKRNRRPPERE